MNEESVVNIRHIRKENWPYIFIWIIYYAWVIVFTTWWTVSGATGAVYSSGMRSLLHSLNLISSAVFVFVVKKEWFMKLCRIGGILLILSIGAFLATKNPTLDLILATLIGILLGCVNVGILMPFVFALNNTEKFYAVVGSNLLISLFIFLQETSVISPDRSMPFSFAMLLLALSSILFFKKDCIKHEELERPVAPSSPSKIMYITFVINGLFAILCKGVGKGILDITISSLGLGLMPWHYVGGFIGCIVYILTFALLKKSIHYAWNIAFGCYAIGLLFNSFSANAPLLAYAFSFLLGIGNTVGMINMYYMLGVIGKKHQSLPYIRWSVLFIGVCGGVSGVLIGNVISHSNISAASLIASVVSAAASISFLLVSPALSLRYYNGEWVADLERAEINSSNDDFFRRHGLNNRETQVCRLLVDGYTIRQTAAILGLRYPTVNTYCTSIYRKLNINSRIELVNLVRKDS